MSEPQTGPADMADIGTSIHCSTLLVADHAEAVNGKLYVVGGCFDSIYSAAFPAEHPHMSVAACLHVPWSATNAQHQLQLDVRDADGRSLLPEQITGNFETGRPPGMRPGDDTSLVIVFNLNGMRFPQPGRYQIVLGVDGEPLRQLRLNLRDAQPQPGPPGPPG